MSSRRRTNFLANIAVATILLIVGAVVVGGMHFAGFFSTTEAKGCVVTEKGSVLKDKKHEYRIYTENCDVMSLSDSLVDGQFASASVYGQIKEGETLDITTRGPRIPILSVFPNIISVKKS